LYSMQKLKTIIIENDPKSLSLLLSLISGYCPELNVVATATNIQDATKIILNHQPALVFLDIELDDGTGFDVLYQVPDKKFKTIVVSGFKRYACDAFRFEITHYLLKPVCVRDLRIAVERVLQHGKSAGDHNKITETTEHARFSKKKLQVSTNEGIKLINLNEIEYLRADGSYTMLHFINKGSIIASRHLKSFESALCGSNFYRLGRTHIINLDCVKVYNKQSGGKITMMNGDTIIIPRRKKDDFLQYLNSYLNSL